MREVGTIRFYSKQKNIWKKTPKEQDQRVLVNLQATIIHKAWNSTLDEKFNLCFSVDFDYNHGHNFVRIFDVLPNFPFTTSETKPDY